MSDKAKITDETAIDVKYNVMHFSNLRIGNIVMVDNEKHHPEIKDVPMVITSISRNYIHQTGYRYYCELDKLIQEKYDWKNYSQFIEFLKPVEITKYWLEKLGFEEVYCSNFNLKYELKKDNRFEIVFNLVDNFITARISGEVLRKRKFIHEIQNLYYALMSDELIYSA